MRCLVFCPSAASDVSAQRYIIEYWDDFSKYADITVHEVNEFMATGKGGRLDDLALGEQATPLLWRLEDSSRNSMDSMANIGGCSCGELVAAIVVHLCARAPPNTPLFYFVNQVALHTAEVWTREDYCAAKHFAPPNSYKDFVSDMCDGVWRLYRCK